MTTHKTPEAEAATDTAPSPESDTTPQAKDAADADAPKRRTRPARLSINLGSEPAAALRDLMTRKGVSATEAIRRALSIWKFIEDQRQAGNRVFISNNDGKGQREVYFFD